MRMIDADALEPHEQLEPMGNGQYEYVEVVYKDDIDDAPTIDAVPVVRCKDCKHRHEDECPMQFEEQFDIDEDDGYYDTEYITHDYTRDDGFCSWGEREEL